MLSHIAHLFRLIAIGLNTHLFQWKKNCSESVFIFLSSSFPQMQKKRTPQANTRGISLYSWFKTQIISVPKVLENLKMSKVAFWGHWKCSIEWIYIFQPCIKSSDFQNTYPKLGWWSQTHGDTKYPKFWTYTEIFVVHFKG